MEQEILSILKSIEQDMQSIHDDLDIIHADVNIIKSTINDIKADVTDIKADVDIIKNNLTAVDKNISKIKERQDTLCLASNTILDQIQSISSLQTLQEIVKQNCYDIACLKAKSKNS